jgi:hypothetical protein
MRWGADAILFIAVGLGLGALAVGLYLDDSIGWAVAAGAGSLIVLATAFLSRKATCPGCGGEVRVVAIGGSVHRCPRCDVYHRLQGGSLTPVLPGAIEAAPSFAVRLDRLGPPASWAWPEPGRCCVCGEPAARQDELRITMGTGYAAAGMMVETTTWTLRIPHCAAHRDGVANGSDFDEANVSHVAVLFRSHDFYLAFRGANGIARPGAPAPRG